MWTVTGQRFWLYSDRRNLIVFTNKTAILQNFERFEKNGWMTFSAQLLLFCLNLLRRKVHHGIKVNQTNPVFSFHQRCTLGKKGRGGRSEAGASEEKFKVDPSQMNLFGNIQFFSTYYWNRLNIITFDFIALASMKTYYTTGICDLDHINQMITLSVNPEASAVVKIIKHLQGGNGIARNWSWGVALGQCFPKSSPRSIFGPQELFIWSARKEITPI